MRAADASRLADAYAALAVVTGRPRLAPGELAVRRLEASSPFYAAMTSGEELALVIASYDQTPQPPLRLESFSAEFGVFCTLQEGETRERLRVSLLRCHSSRRDIRDLFLVVCNAVIDRVGTQVSDADVARAIADWVGLFRKLQMPSRSTITGLIGELTFINSCDDVTNAVRAWHHDVTDTVDFIFAAPAVEIEVKATTGARRSHELSLSQLQHSASSCRYFASVLVDLRPSGAAVADLVDLITSKLTHEDDVLLLWRGMVDTCGDRLSEFLAQRFLLDDADASIELYLAESIPQPAVALPIDVGVSNIRFRSDFSGATPITRAEICSRVRMMNAR